MIHEKGLEKKTQNTLVAMNLIASIFYLIFPRSFKRCLQPFSANPWLLRDSATCILINLFQSGLDEILLQP